MSVHKPLNLSVILTVCLIVAACGSRSTGPAITAGASPPANSGGEFNTRDSAPTAYEKSSIWEVFGPNKTEQTVNVNRYIWAASLDVLSFLPVQTVDPFTGVIVTGYGTPPGGGRSYRATVHIKDPALEARSLKLALHTQGGPVSAATTRAVEDAILSRARQMRINDDAL